MPFMITQTQLHAQLRNMADLVIESVSRLGYCMQSSALRTDRLKRPHSNRAVRFDRMALTLLWRFSSIRCQRRGAMLYSI